ncbi:MAG: TolC family protein, partial [Alphaproteobacteria bacterium]
DGEFYSVGVEATQTVLSFGRNSAARKSGDAGILEADADFQQIGQEVAAETGSALVAVLTGSHTSGLWNSHVRTLEKQLADARDKTEQNIGAISDLRDIRARYATARAGALNARDEYRAARTNLFTLMGIEDKGQQFTLWPDGEGKSEGLLSSLNGLTIAATRANPVLSSVRAARQRAEAEFDRARSELYPKLDITGSANTGAIDGDDTSSATIGIAATMPLYEGGALRARVKRTKAQLAAAEARESYILRTLNTRLANHWRSLNAARHAHSEWETALAERRQTVRETKLEVDQGLKPVGLLYDLEEDALSDAITVIKRRYGLVDQCIQLLAVAGLLSADQSVECVVAGAPIRGQKPSSARELREGRAAPMQNWKVAHDAPQNEAPAFAVASQPAPGERSVPTTPNQTAETKPQTTPSRTVETPAQVHSEPAPTTKAPVETLPPENAASRTPNMAEAPTASNAAAGDRDSLTLDQMIAATLANEQ